MEQETPPTASHALSQVVGENEPVPAPTAGQSLWATTQKTDDLKSKPPKEAIQPYDFRGPARLSLGEFRKLRLQHEEFIKSLTARLSIYLRLEFDLQMAKLEMLPYHKFIEGLSTPTHLTLFRVEPLPGLCLLEITPRLGLAIVDRLMGGPGQMAKANHDLSEIEVALLEQAIQIIVGEWGDHWAKVQEVRPVLLGHESNGRYLHAAAGDAILFVLTMEARVGEETEQLQMAFPYPTLEPLIQALNQPASPPSVQAVSKPGAKWNPALDEVMVPVAAAWPERQLSARQLTQLKVGDVLEWNPQAADQVRLRIGGRNKFIGRIGTQNQKWAIEITGPCPLSPA